MTLKALRVDGGASANDFLMQFQADILDTEIARPTMIESTALGAVCLAGLAAGFYADRRDIARAIAADRVFTPAMDAGKREELLRGWNKAVACARGWAG